MRLVDLIPLKEMYNPADAFNKKAKETLTNKDYTLVSNSF